jgi:phosphatidylinositol glycan class W
MLASPAILLLLSVKPRKQKAKPLKSSVEAASIISRQAFLTTYRGSMMMITCIAILAVDFRVFPRRFAKVENWGTSLMDLGVGSFVFSAGLVSASSVLKSKSSEHGLLSRLYTAGRHSLPLFVLGIIRLYSVNGLDYAEHVTEYGVHWNFFFTLALLPPFVAIFQSIFSIVPSYALLALLVGIIYQVVLESTSLKAYILIAPRTDLLSQNREGVFSFIGYLAIFLAGQATGMDVLPATVKYPSTVSRWISNAGGSSRVQKLLRHPRAPIMFRLVGSSLLWTSLFIANHSIYGAGISISRRLANLTYILWVAAFNNVQILAFCLIDTVIFSKSSEASKDQTVSRILNAFNRNGLAIFLLANLLTGLVNLTLPTLHLSTLSAMSILIIYVAVLSTAAVGLDAYNVSIKL